MIRLSRHKYCTWLSLRHVSCPIVLSFCTNLSKYTLLCRMFVFIYFLIERCFITISFCECLHGIRKIFIQINWSQCEICFAKLLSYFNWSTTDNINCHVFSIVFRDSHTNVFRLCERILIYVEPYLLILGVFLNPLCMTFVC